MSKLDVTIKQQEILDYIKLKVLEKGYAPTVREICLAVGLKSSSSVHSHLETLERKGYIRRDPTKPRTIEIADECFGLEKREIVNVPLVGVVAAGQPIFAEENIQSYFPIPIDLLPNTDVFLLKVRGDSMINAGIYNGDQVIVSMQDTAENGEIVVALVGDCATVKRFYKEDGYYRLQPENDSMEPIIVDDVKIQGKVIGVVRLM